MGLDMYAFVTEEKPATAVDFPEPANSEELHYWRKHPNLHGWMQKLYVEKGGAGEDFNLDAVILDSADLDRLEAAVVDNCLPETSGFFFGQSRDLERDRDLAFIRKAREAIAAGKSVFYVASW